MEKLIAFCEQKIGFASLSYFFMGISQLGVAFAIPGENVMMAIFIALAFFSFLTTILCYKKTFAQVNEQRKGAKMPWTKRKELMFVAGIQIFLGASLSIRPESLVFVCYLMIGFAVLVGFLSSMDVSETEPTKKSA